nr:RNA-directed DNA polymerase, eukaryota [Tanacetum cinerariifolium]
MGDSDWHEVIERKRRSVLDRLTPSRSPNSNVDDLAKISLSVYVSNFPTHLTMRELWNICGKVGTVADVYIAKRKNKFGQMFAFCRYIKVVNIENLISSLSNIWVGKLRLHANVARVYVSPLMMPVPFYPSFICSEDVAAIFGSEGCHRSLWMMVDGLWGHLSKKCSHEAMVGENGEHW